MTPVYPRQNVGRRGADIAAGQTVVRGRPGAESRAAIGALAATGVADVEVYARPSVAILSTGNEIAEPGQPLAPGQIYDINRFTLETIVRRHGGVARRAADRRRFASRSSRPRSTPRAAHDIIVFSGGSSVGERDLILDVLRGAATVHFHGIAVKPGKPTVFGTIGGTPVFGMPGYPTSCLSNAYMLLRAVPAARSRGCRRGRRARSTRRSPAAIVSTTGRHQFYTVRLVDGRAEPAFKASGDITSMANADGYIEIPAADGCGRGGDDGDGEAVLSDDCVR